MASICEALSEGATFTRTSEHPGAKSMYQRSSRRSSRRYNSSSGYYGEGATPDRSENLWKDLLLVGGQFVTLIGAFFSFVTGLGLFMLKLSLRNPLLAIVCCAAASFALEVTQSQPRFHYPVSDWITLEECESIYKKTRRAHENAYMELQDAMPSFWGTPSPFPDHVLRERQQKFNQLSIELDRVKTLLDVRWAEERATLAKQREAHAWFKANKKESPSQPEDE